MQYGAKSTTELTGINNYTFNYKMFLIKYLDLGIYYLQFLTYFDVIFIGV
jgi:hypothetical protein